MGDLSALMEKIHSVVDQQQIQKNIEQGVFTLKEFESQLDSLGQIGSFDKLMDLIPGLGKAKDKIPHGKLEEQESKIKAWKHIIKSMTSQEIKHPEILEKQTSRIQRIATGSGSGTSQVRALLKQYKMMNEMISSQSDLANSNLDQKTLMKFAKKFGRKMKF